MARANVPAHEHYFSPKEPRVFAAELYISPQKSHVGWCICKRWLCVYVSMCACVCVWMQIQLLFMRRSDIYYCVRPHSCVCLVTISFHLILRLKYLRTKSQYLRKRSLHFCKGVLNLRKRVLNLRKSAHERHIHIHAEDYAHKLFWDVYLCVYSIHADTRAMTQKKTVTLRLQIPPLPPPSSNVIRFVFLHLCVIIFEPAYVCIYLYIYLFIYMYISIRIFYVCVYVWNIHICILYVCTYVEWI